MTNYIVIGVGLGDEGKGATVDYLCATQEIDLVVRFNGGFQAAHNVVLPDGRHHTFSQFGSGTLREVPTYIDRNVIVDPFALWAEAKHLDKLGIIEPQQYIRINPDCLVSTIYHKNLNRVENSRSGHGSCGVGISTTRRMWSQTGDGLRFGDLLNRATVKRKLGWIRQWCGDQQPYDRGVADINIFEGNPINFTQEVNDLHNSTSQIRTSYGDILNSASSVVFEGSQGFGLDEVYGTIPHTTYSDTTPRYAVELCDEFGLEYETIGVTRAYGTRHGNGPLYGEGNANISRDIETDHNYHGAYAGKFRHGHLHISQIEDAIDICKVDKLAVTCLDHRTRHDQYDVLDKLSKLAPIWLTSYGKTSDDRKLYV